MKVLVAMSGGVDSAVAALLLADAGHDVTGVTMRLWGGESDTGCCSVSDVDDARRTANRLGLEHLVFNFTEEFERDVVDPYVEAHRLGETPNPCIECNRHLKFDRLTARARMLGFDAVATGHHATVVAGSDGRARVGRGADPDKDQSYVVHMLDGADLGAVTFPVGHLTKAQVRGIAADRGLRVAAKPDSQDVCFIGSHEGRGGFLGRRIEMTPADVVDDAGAPVGRVPAVQLVTIGQRRGLGLGGGDRRYVVDIDRARALVVVGDETSLDVTETHLERCVWPHDVDVPVAPRRVKVQSSAHGAARAATISLAGDGSSRVRIVWDAPTRRISPGQSVVFYDAENRVVTGGGIAV